ncbi:MAG: hypothetical protein H6586_01550 [Flavobacteriales bacterium]|nr:hypothetical protein [Flavobacteriales bacterium]
MKKLVVVSIVLITIMFSCSKDEDSTPEPTAPVVSTGGGGGSTTSYPSPCTATLTNNEAVCTPNVFTGLSTLTLTAVLSNDSKEVNADVVGTFPVGGDMDIKLGSVISAGEFPLEQNPFPDAGKALLTFIPNLGNNFLSTSGTLYISETSTQWILEWCDVNCNSSSTSTSCTGRMVVDK